MKLFQKEQVEGTCSAKCMKIYKTSLISTDFGRKLFNYEMLRERGIERKVH